MTLFGGLGWHVAVFRHDSNVACPQLGPSRLHLLRVEKGLLPGLSPLLVSTNLCFGGVPTLRYSALVAEPPIHWLRHGIKGFKGEARSFTNEEGILEETG